MIPDEEILERVRRGDETAIKMLVDRYGRSMKGFLRKKYGHVLSTEDREQVLWQAILQFWQKRDKFNRKMLNLGSYLIVIADRIAIDRFRRNGRRPKLFSLDMDATTEVRDEAEQENSARDIAADDRPAFSDLLTIVCGLSDFQRGVLFEYVRTEGRGPWAAEYAICERVSPSYVRSTLWKTVQLIRRRMRELGYNIPLDGRLFDNRELNSNAEGDHADET